MLSLGSLTLIMPVKCLEKFRKVSDVLLFRKRNNFRAGPATKTDNQTCVDSPTAISQSLWSFEMSDWFQLTLLIQLPQLRKHKNTKVDFPDSTVESLSTPLLIYR